MLIQRPWARQPQSSLALRGEWRARGFTEVFNRGVGQTGQLIRLAGGANTPAAIAACPLGVGPQIVADITNAYSAPVNAGSAWSVVIALKLDAAVASDYIYFLRPSGASFGWAIRNVDFADRSTYYDGTAQRDSGFTVAVLESAVVGLTWDSAAYTFFKNGAQFNTVAGVSAGTGDWIFASYAAARATITYPLIAFADRAVPNEYMRAATANPWQLFAPLPRRMWAPSAATGIPTLSAATVTAITATTATPRVTITF
jgi:hypothetical protein